MLIWDDQLIGSSITDDNIAMVTSSCPVVVKKLVVDHIPSGSGTRGRRGPRHNNISA